MNPVLEARNIRKKFFDPVEVEILRGLDLKVMPGEFVSIMGKSGCGKSTLLYVLSTMDTQYEGELYLAGQAYRAKSPMNWLEFEISTLDLCFNSTTSCPNSAY